MQTGSILHRRVRAAASGACALLMAACGADSNSRQTNSPNGGSTADGGDTSKGGASSGGSSGTGVAGTAGVGNVSGMMPPDGAPPLPSVGDCNGLGDVDAFQNITPPGVTEVLHVLVDPVNSGTVYAGTTFQGIYKSTNCGATWALASTGTNSDIVNSGGQWSMQIDQKFPNVIYSGNLYAKDNALYKSTNGGVDWTSLFPPGSEIANTVAYVFTQEVAIDPSPDRHAHLVVSFHADCSGPVGPQCMAESLDSGATWRLFKGPASGWTENARPMIIDEKTFLYVTWSGGVFFTTDSGANWARGGEGGNHQMYKTSNGTYFLGTPWGMSKSSDGTHWTKIDNSPIGDGLIGDGDRLFTAKRDTDDNAPYYVSAESDGSTWKPYASPPMPHGAVTLGYDAPHKLLYSANTSAGLWRVKTKAN